MANWAALQEQLTGLPVHKRAKHGIHFKRPDGLIEASFVGKPCHYLDGAVWRAIDTKLIKLSDGWYGSPHSDVRIHPDGRVKVTNSDYQQFTELPSAKTGAWDGDKLIRTFTGGEQHLIMKEGGFKEEIHVFKPTFPIEKFIAKTAGTLPGKYTAHPVTAEDADGNTYEFTGDVVAFGAWLASAKYPVVIDPDFAGATGDTTAYSDDADYATAHATGDKLIATDLYTGQMLSGGLYYVYRSILSFDTSSIDDGETIAQNNLKMTVHYEQSATDFDVQIVKDDWSGHSTTDQKFDGVLAATQDDNIFCNTAGKSAGSQYTSGNLSTAWVNKTGVTYYGLRSSLDVAETAPSGNDRFVLYDSGAAAEGNRPVLTVTYATVGVPKHFMHYQRMRG